MFGHSPGLVNRGWTGECRETSDLSIGQNDHPHTQDRGQKHGDDENVLYLVVCHQKYLRASLKQAGCQTHVLFHFRQLRICRAFGR